MEAVCEQSGIDLEVMADDLQHLIDEEEREILQLAEAAAGDGLELRDPSASQFDENNFNRLRQIEGRLVELQTQYSSQMSVSSIGKTSQGRDIKMARLSSGYGGQKAAVWLDCGIHAREWVSPAFCMHALRRMLDDGEGGATETLLFADFVVILIFVFVKVSFATLTSTWCR